MTFETILMNQNPSLVRRQCLRFALYLKKMIEATLEDEKNLNL